MSFFIKNILLEKLIIIKSFSFLIKKILNLTTNTNGDDLKFYSKSGSLFKKE